MGVEERVKQRDKTKTPVMNETRGIKEKPNVDKD